MSCPNCGRDGIPDPETGYDGADLCPSCQADGFVEVLIGGKVQIANERDRKGGKPEFWPAGDWPREFPEPAK